MVPNNPEDDIFNQNHDDPQEAAPLLPEIAGIVHHNGALNGAVGEEEEAEEEAEENENIQEAAVMPPPVPSAGPSPALPPKPRTLPENPISAHSEPLQLVPAAGGPIPHASTSSPLEGQGPSRNDQTPSEPKHHPLPLVPTNPGDFSLSMPPINARDRELRPTLEAQEDQRRSSETSSPSTPHDGEFQVRKSEESGKNSASAAAAAAAEIYPSLLNVDAIQPNVDDVHLEAISSHEERQDELAPFLSRNRGMKIMIHDDRSEEKKTKDEIEEEKGKEDTTSSISELMIPCLDSYREEQHEHSSTFSETNFGHPVDLEDIQLQNLLADSAAYNPEESGGGPSNHSSGHTDARFPSHCTPFPEDDPSCFLPSVHHQSINDGVGIIPPSPSPSPPPPMHRDQKSVPCDSINGEKKSFSPSSPILSPPPALTTTTSSCPNLASMTGPLSKRLRRLHSLQQKSGEVCETKENENGRLVEGVNKASIQPKLHLTISDAPVKSRAKASLPSTHLLLEEVPGKPPKIRAKLNILAGTNFGPLEGVRLCRVRFQDGIASDVFFVTSGDGQLHQIHAIDENVSNWMMFVPRARNSNDRLDSNLEAFENDGQIFFRATKDIAPEDELKYQLSVEYLEKYDLAAADFSDHNDEDNLTNGDSTSISFYSCETCPLNFNTSGVLRLHSIIHTLEEDAEDSAATVNGSVKKSCPECQMCVGTSQWHLAVHVSKYHGWKKNSNYGKSKSRKRLKLFSSTEKLKV